jgi:hypothetical protein
MALHYESLNAATRLFMTVEVRFDVAADKLYVSDRLNDRGRSEWAALIELAAEQHDDVWLASEIRRKDLLNPTEVRRKPKGGTTVAQIPHTAADTFAEGEFNRFYVRGLCARAIEEAIPEVEVYRARHVENPRPASEAMIGRRMFPIALLTDLRASQGVEPALGLPPGPNSTLSVRLVR